MLKGKEQTFYDHELFFSHTNHLGEIQCGNDVFIRVSGYTQDEILNKPHSIIRHPFMPKSIFYFFWNELKAKRPIISYVVNKAKNGE